MRVIVVNLSIIILVGLAFYVTHSLWSFLGLFFLFSSYASTIKTKCPKCGHKFIAVKKYKKKED